MYSYRILQALVIASVSVFQISCASATLEKLSEELSFACREAVKVTESGDDTSELMASLKRRTKRFSNALEVKKSVSERRVFDKNITNLQSSSQADWTLKPHGVVMSEYCDGLDEAISIAGVRTGTSLKSILKITPDNYNHSSYNHSSSLKSITTLTSTLTKVIPALIPKQRSSRLLIHPLILR